MNDKNKPKPTPVRVAKQVRPQFMKLGLAQHSRKNRLKRLIKVIRVFVKVPKTIRGRMLSLAAIVVLLVSIALPVLQEQLNHKIYALDAKESALLSPASQAMADKLKYEVSDKGGVYEFNKGYTPSNPGTQKSAGGAQISAKIFKDPTQGFQITDPVNKIDFKMKPLFELGEGKQDQNRLIYPTYRGRGHLVYTTLAGGVKEDITLQQYVGDKLSFSYRMELGDTFAAKILPDGSVGVYGSSLPLNGNVSTGNDQDAALLKKARQKAAKNKLLFTIPAPVIRETSKHKSEAKASFSLEGDKLTVKAQNLKKANYPLSIDPTITAAVTATTFLFDANLETNADIDTTSNLLKRGALNGGNVGSWTGSSSVSAAHFLGGAVIYGGTLFVIGGAKGTTANIQGGDTTYVEQAKINSNGSVSTFSAGNATGLPAGGLSRFKLLTYNGYMYIINGSLNDTTGTTLSNVIYYTRITSESFASFTNGAQLLNWKVTSNAANAPATARFDYGAAIYNGFMYVSGGRTASGVATGVNTVTHAAILPDGSPGTWSTDTAMPGAGRYGHDMQAYNGRLYVIGGNQNGTLLSAVLYASIASDGSVADTAWKSTNSLVNSGGTGAQTMENLGAVFSMVNNGYMYVTGGCTAVNATNQNCTAVASYTQLAQVNADGSLGSWFPNSGGTTLPRTGTPVTDYNGAFYSVGGCSAMANPSVSCSTTSLTSNYAAVNGTTAVGDISAKRTPTALPVALYGQATVVLNGFLYVLGGCLNVSCDGIRSANYITYYNAIAADGTLSGTWGNNTSATTPNEPLRWDGQSTVLFGSPNCSDSNDQCGLAGIAATVYNGYIYVVGGYDGANYNSAVYYQKPNADGTTNTWTKGATIANAAVELGAFAHNGVLYSIGGCSVASGSPKGIGCSTYYTQVQKSTIGAAGAPGTFTLTNAGTQTQLTAGIATFGLTYYGGFIYLAGGASAANAQTAVVLRAKLDSSGNIADVDGETIVNNTWKATTGSMSQARRRTVATVVNGYLYVIGGHSAADLSGGANGTTYGDIQIGKIDLSVGSMGDIAVFTQSPGGTVTARWNPAISFGNGFMYVTGGCTAGFPPQGCTTVGTTNESFVVYNANNLGADTWNNQSNVYATNRLGAAAAAYNGYLYVAGGCTTYTMTSPTLSCSAVTSNVSYAAINADGTFGTWQNAAGYNLPAASAYGQLIAQNGYLYYLGGQTAADISGAQSTVYKSTIGASGLPGAFSSSGQTALSTALTQAAAVTYAGFIFIAGGYTGSANSNNVYTSTINGSGDITAWTARTAFPNTARRELSLVTAGAYIYVLGGFDGTIYYNDVQVATPSTTNGNITSWSSAKDLPYKVAGMSAVASNGYIYTFGGRNGTTSTSCNNLTNSATVNGNGSLSDWQQSSNVFLASRFGATGTYYNGYFFVNGGHDCTALVSTNVSQQSGQLSQAIKATYSRYVDFGTDATPRQFFATGTNAAISGNDIDRWRVIYKSSRGATNSWSGLTSSTITTFGYNNPINFVPVDGSGVNQGSAQYWQITFDIDQSQSFGFPDGNQPTITRYDFYFSPGPAKRLRNGKTFINETQTTLDAHP